MDEKWPEVLLQVSHINYNAVFHYFVLHAVKQYTISWQLNFSIQYHNNFNVIPSKSTGKLVSINSNDLLFFQT
jgi:hypothetical protein